MTWNTHTRLEELKLLGAWRDGVQRSSSRRARVPHGGRWTGSWATSRCSTPIGDFRTADRQNFGRMLLVFGCIGSDFCNKICVLQHFSKSTRFSSWNFWNLAIFCKFCDICEIFAEFSRKLLFFQTDFLRKFWDCSGAKGCKSCRAWKMLSNAYFLAKFGFDTAENEPAKNL